ncbi:MAG: PAS domain S-box protein, partial [Balneolaceae bacterium]
MPLNSLPWVFRQISENKIINLPIKELPSPEREFMMDQEIKSFLLIPIFIEDDWFGFLGFDSTRYEKIWDEHEITLLKTASDIIGTYFKRKSVEESLLQQKNFTQEILNSLPGIVVLVNKKLEFLQWNKTAERLIGYTKEELSKMNAYDIIAPEDHKNLESTLLRVLQRDNEGQELTLLHKNGKRNPYFWRRNFLELDGETVFINVGLNISKQKEMEHALLEEKRLADAIINSLPGIFYIINRKGNYVRVNNNFLKEFDYTESEVLNMTPLDFYSPKEHKEVTERLEKLFAGGSASFELNPMAKSGKKIPYYLKTVRFDRKNESYVIGTGHNISEQKVKEAELLASVKEKDVLLQEIHHRV